MLWVCAECGARFAPGAERCPQCGSIEYWIQGEEGEGDMAKIRRLGDVSEVTDAGPPAPSVADVPAEPEPALDPLELVAAEFETTADLDVARGLLSALFESLPEADRPERPADADLKQAWIDYAVELGVPHGNAEALTKVELQDLLP